MDCVTLKIRLEGFSLATGRIVSGQTHWYFNELLGEKNGWSGFVIFGNVKASHEQGLAGIDCCAWM